MKSSPDIAKSDISPETTDPTGTTEKPDRRTSWQWRRPRKGETDYELLWLLLLPFSGLVTWGMVLLDLPLFRCQFKESTGIPCLTCGGSRCLRSVVLEHDLWAAFVYNPLVFLTLGLFGAIFLYALIVKIFRLPRFRFTLSRRTKRIVSWSFLAAIILNWAFLIWAGR